VEANPADITTDRGVTIGMTRTQVTTLLGQPSRDSADVVIYDWTRNRRGRFGTRDEVMYSESSTLEITCQAGIAVRIAGDRIDVS
jgi:outer membrane protein assembly factor BamE (lipoprotein component of BamABCDE complex)